MLLVTGGAGFIGSALIWKLNQKGYKDIIVVDSLGRDEKWRNLSSLEISDYYDKEQFRELLLSGFNIPNLKAVFHLGADSSTLQDDMGYLLDNNFSYSKLLCEWSLEKGVRFIYASSAATYGGEEKNFSDDESQLFSLRPLNPYGYSKHLFDCWALKKGYFKKIVGLKFFNVFGPNEYHKGEMKSMVLKAYQQIESEGKVKLFKSYRNDYPDGCQQRDFVYVKDVVEIVYRIFQNKKISGIFNVGTGKSNTFLRLVELIFQILGKEKMIEFIDMPSYLKDKYQYSTRAKMEKLFSYLPFSFRTLEESLKDYVLEYLIKNQKRLELDDGE